MPISNIFNLLEDYLDLGYTILLDTLHFSKDLRAWENTPETEQTWENFKTFFHQAHEELHEFAAPGYAEHANIIVSQVAARLQEYSLPTIVPSSYYTSADSFVPSLIEIINSMQAQIVNLTVAAPLAITTSSVTKSFAHETQLPPVPNYAMYAATQPPTGYTQHPNTRHNSGTPDMGGHGQQNRGRKLKNHRNQQNNHHAYSMPNPPRGFPPQYNYYTHPGQHFSPKQNQNFPPQKYYQPPFGQNLPNGAQNPTSQRPTNQCIYCWTHSLCNHLGATCRNPTDGHQAQATLENPDSGASKHYVKEGDAHLLQNAIPNTTASVTLPDNSTTRYTKSGNLPLKHISNAASKSYALKNLHSASLLSLGQLYDNNCVVILCKQSIDVLKNNTSILRGTRNLKDGLWDISIPNKNKEQHLRANVILPHQSNSVLIHFYHGCFFSPAKSTWLQAIKKGNFVTWLGLTYNMVSKYYPDTSATVKGHLNQERQNLYSTSTPHIIPPSTTN